MSEWKECKLGDIARINYGKGLPAQKRKLGSVPVFSSAGIAGWHNAPLVNNKGIIIGRKGTVGTVYYSDKPFFCIDTAYYIEPDEAKYDIRYLFYLLGTIGLTELNEDSAVPGLNRNTAYDQDILLPPIPEQCAIADVLSSLDDKIELLHRQNKTLEGIAEALWRKMFVEEVDLGWISKSLGDFFPILTGKKDANYSTEDGQYPFFTCSRNTLKSPGYSFDGHAILLAGNGDFNLKRYKGKFEAYQRTYVLIPHNELEVGFLYYGMRQHLEDITMGYRGSVINFITKGMIENFQMLMMPDTSIFYEVCRLFNEINEKIDSNDRQVRTLSRLRDTLLPKLMSGEVRVKI